MDSRSTRQRAYEDRREAQHWSRLRPEDGAREPAPEENPWAWAGREAPESERVDVSDLHVTAVLVTFEADRWLPATLAGLAALHPRPARLIAIDNDSSDTTRALLQRALEQGVLDAVYDGKRSFGFGQAVKAALRQDRGRAMDDTGHTGLLPALTRDGSTAEQHWLWLLHDDAAPSPDALYRLLAHVAEDRTIDITGPKLLLPRRRQAGQQLSEVGVSISGTGRRELGLDVGEIDQGQRDQPEARLGVSTCGMLVRAEVWQDLDGLDPAVPVFRDGVEFGWRAHLNDYRVVTTPAALFTHRQVGRGGLRPQGLTGRRPGRVDRLLGMVVVAGHAPGRMLPLVWLRLVWSCLVHAVAYLFGKVPGRALDEMAALVAFVGHPGRIGELRGRVAAIDPAPGTAEVVKTLRPPWWGSLRVGVEAVGAAVSDRYHSVAGDTDSATLDELTGDDFSAVADERKRNPWLSPVVITLVLSVVASVVAARDLFGLGSLASPTLLPAQAHLADLWRSVWNPIAGAPDQSSPPWLAVTAVAATVLVGRPEWLVTLLVCAVVPLALLAVYPVVRRAVGDRRLRLWVAVTYALLPVLLGGSNQGRLSLSVVAVLLPLLVMAVRALVLRRVRTPEAWRGAWGAGVVLVVLVAFEPSLLVLALLGAVAGLLVLRRTPRKLGRIGIAIGLPLVVLLPWWPSLIAHPGRLLVGPDSPLQGVATAPQVWSLLLGRGLGTGLPPFWLGATVTGLIWLVGLAGLLRRPRRRTVLAAWVVALLSFGLAVVLSRLVVSVPPIGTEVRPWVGVHLLIGFAALAFGGAVGVDGLSQELKNRSFSSLQPLIVLAAVVLAAVSVSSAAWWVWAGARGPVERVRLDAVPPYVLNVMQDQSRGRVLAIDLTSDRTRYTVLADDQIRLGDADRGYTFQGSAAARAEIDDLVVRIVAGTADSQVAPQLTELGVRYVWVTGVSNDEASRIDNTPGLGSASGTAGGTVWQVDPAVSRATLSDGTTLSPVGPSPTSLPAGAAGRQLRLGEAADPRWHAELDGRPLAPVTNGWQQTFAVPATGGTLTYGLSSTAHWFLFGQGLVLLVAGVLAAPGVRRPEVRDPARSARRAATLNEVS